MKKKYLVCLGFSLVLLSVTHIVSAKMWLSPEVIDNTDSANHLGNISAAINQNQNLYLTWENVINETAPHSYNLFWKLRYRSLAWSDSFQLTHHIFDTTSGVIYPNMDWNIGFYTGDNVYLTYSQAGVGYVFRHMGTGDTSTIDPGGCGTSGNGAAIAAEEPIDYHVLYLKCPERRLYYNKFNEMPAEHGWGTPVALTEAGHIIFNYDIAVDHDRNIYVVWSEQTSTDPARTSLKYLKHTEAGGWDATPTVLAVASTIAGVKVATDLDGHVHVVWRELDPADHPSEDIFYRTWRASAWSPEINLSNGDEVSADPTMVVTLDNHVHVAWIAADRTIAYRQWDGDWQPIVHLSEGSASRPFITSDRADNLYLFYSGAKPGSASETQLMLLRYSELSAHTPEGSDIRLDLNGHSITFDEVTTAGVTTITAHSDGSPLGAGYQLACTPPQYFDISTTAHYRAPIEVCLNYDDSVCNEADLQLLHKHGDSWVDITTSQDTENNVICGRIIGGLSEFALARPAGSMFMYPAWRLAMLIAIILVTFIWTVIMRIKSQ